MRDHGRCKFADTFDNAIKIADIEKEVSEMKQKMNKPGRDEKTSDKSDDFQMKLESIIRGLKEKDSHVKPWRRKSVHQKKNLKIE